MLDLNGLRQESDLLDRIDWEMTPTEAVTLYLEWGNNWAHGNYVIRSKDDVSHYFVVNTWEGRPVIYLIRRNSEAAEELARIEELPEELKARFMHAVGHNKGVYAVEGEVKRWLQTTLGTA